MLLGVIPMFYFGILGDFGESGHYRAPTPQRREPTPQRREPTPQRSPTPRRGIPS